MKDRRGIERGRCNESMCPCTEYEVDAGAILCSYCGHVPLQHTELTVLMKPSNIMDNPRQENNSLEEILNGTSSVSVNMNSNLPSSSNHGACKSSHIVTENQFSESALEISEPTLESSEQIVSEVSSMDSNQLTLPNFSDFVIPYLQGENLCLKLKNTMRNIIIETLIEFLDKNNMLTGKSKIQQALGSKALGRRLLLKYPKIHREDCTSKRRRKEELGFLISRLADRRRVRKNRERQKEKQSPFFKNSEEALSFLHDFKLENFKTMDKLVEALYMTKDKRSNYALETIPEYLLHSKAITYQVQLTLSSTFDDMRCTLLRLLEKVKKLGLKNCLELIKYLNITSNNEDGSGNLLEEGIPEVIPKRDGPCFYLQDAKKTSKGIVYILEEKVIEFKD